MALVPGTRLGPYEVIAPAGAGGMGEVYRGRDTRLDRTVAIKVLPDAVARDPERLARFEREAKILATLNHTNIAQIYGLEEGALAMEFVEGEDLAQRLSRGPLPLDDALSIASQIADALEAAHELGIVHRDLKPSNIRIRNDGTVKVLDFGLAKALSPAVDLAGMASAPTITSPAMTGLGTILGTAVYMAPEQAKGRFVDKRGDIWAFGVVVYEMVTGKRPFEGETVSEVLAAVIKSEPDLTPVPPQLQRLIRSCLDKDPKRRLRDIGDWRRELDQPSAGHQSQRANAWLPWAAAATMLIVAASVGVVHFREVPPPLNALRFEIPPPDGQTFRGAFSLAPDGRRVAFIALDGRGTRRIWVRDFDALEPRLLDGTEGAAGLFWRPDGQFIAFTSGRGLKKVPVKGGPVVTLCEADANTMGSVLWSPTGVMLLGGTIAGVIRRVSESGGDMTPLTSLNSNRRDLVHGIPSFLPDGRHFLYLAVSAIEDQSAIFVGSIDRTPEQQDREPILTIPGGAQYTDMDSQGGRLLFLRRGTLMAQPFDPVRLALTGEAVPIAEHVSNTGALGYFSATSNALVYRTGAAAGAGVESRLTWVDRQDKPLQELGPPTTIGSVDLAPDGHRAALSFMPSLNIDVWLADLDRDVFTPLTRHPTADRDGIWSPDGTRIAFRSNRNGPWDLFVKAANGNGDEEALLKSADNKLATSWSPDGQFLLYQTEIPSRGGDLWVLPLQGTREPVAILRSEFNEVSARFSPDGHWIAYQSNLSGRSEIYLRPFDPASPGASGSAMQVTKDGGSIPKWRQDGKELYYVGPDGRLMAVDVATSPLPRVGITRALFQLGLPALWAPTRDGKKFLVAVPTVEAGRTPITVVLNWGAPAK